MLKEKILYNEELQYKQKELEINYKNDLNNFIEFLDKIKDVNAQQIDKITFIKILSIRCNITKEEDKIKFDVVMRES